MVPNHHYDLEVIGQGQIYSKSEIRLVTWNSLSFNDRGCSYITQVNRMSRSRRVLAIGGKQRFFGLDMVCIETILFHLESF